MKDRVQTCKIKVPTPIFVGLRCPDWCSVTSFGRSWKDSASTRHLQQARFADDLEGMFYRMRAGCPWRDLPRAFDAGTPSTNASTRGRSGREMAQNFQSITD